MTAEWREDVKAFVRHNANGTDTVLSPLAEIAGELRVMLASAIEHSDGEWITGYTIKTGALHRILGLMQQAGHPVSLPVAQSSNNSSASGSPARQGARPSDPDLNPVSVKDLSASASPATKEQQ